MLLIFPATISADEYFSDPLTRYEVEQAYFYADVDPLYIRYVSDDSSFGADMSLWPETFARWAGVWLALQIAPSVETNVGVDELEKREVKLLNDARAKDSSQEPTRFLPIGSWNRARFGRWGGSRRDRGSRRSLIG